MFRIEDPPGEEKLFILLTRAPESDLDKLIASLRQGESHGPERARTASPVRIADSVVDQIRSQIGERDLVFTKFDDGDDERAVYVVNKAAGGSDARVTVDLTIQHR